MDKIKKAKASLERYLEEKVKDYYALDDASAQLVMSISTMQIWRSWRMLKEFCEGDLK